jgi:hypothetical protein
LSVLPMAISLMFIFTSLKGAKLQKDFVFHYLNKIYVSNLENIICKN